MSYHGTKCDNANSIAQQGYLLSKGHRHLYGKGIYSAPSITVAAGFAAEFEFNRKCHQVVFQNRVSTTGLKVQKTSVGEYWIQPNEKLIRPYGLCIKEV